MDFLVDWTLFSTPVKMSSTYLGGWPSYEPQNKSVHSRVVPWKGGPPDLEHAGSQDDA